MLAKLKLFCFQLLLSCVICSLNADIKAQCFGGQIFTGNASSSISICPADVIQNGLNFYSTSFASTSYAYVVTDINNNILTISTTSTLDFEGLIEGNYFVYGFSYLGDITAKQGDFVYTTKFASICWHISSSRVDVQLTSPLSSEVRTEDFRNFSNLCLNEGAPDLVFLQNTSVQNLSLIHI